MNTDLRTYLDALRLKAAGGHEPSKRELAAWERLLARPRPETLKGTQK